MLQSLRCFGICFGKAGVADEEAGPDIQQPTSHDGAHQQHSCFKGSAKEEEAESHQQTHGGQPDSIDTTPLIEGFGSNKKQAEALKCVKQWLADQTGPVNTANTAPVPITDVLSELEASLLGLQSWDGNHQETALALLNLYADIAHKALNPRHGARAFRTTSAQMLLKRPQPLMLASRTLQHIRAQHSKLEQDKGEGSQLDDQILAACSSLRQMLMLAMACSSVKQQACSDTTTTATDTESQAPINGGLQSNSIDNTSSSMKQQITHTISAWSAQLLNICTAPSGALYVIVTADTQSGNAAVQLAGMQVLRQLYVLQAAGIVQQDIAAMFVAHHYKEFTRLYQAADQDVASQTGADLGRQHLQLVLAAANTSSASVRSILHAQGAVDTLLTEFSLEAKLYSEEQAAAAEDALTTRRSGGDDDDDDMSTSEGDCSLPSSPGSTDRAGGELVPVPPRHKDGAPAQPSPAPRKFTLTGDLNEDLERLAEYEEQTGETVELPGFEYDEEAKEIMARSEARQIPLPTPPTPQSCPRSPRVLPPLRLPNGSPSSVRRASLLSADCHVNFPMAVGPGEARSSGEYDHSSPMSRPSVIPRLALSSLRSAASSRIVTPIHKLEGSLCNSRRSRHGDSVGGHSSPMRAQPSPSSLGFHLTLASNNSGGSAPPGNGPCNPSGSNTARSSARLHHSHLSPLSARPNNQGQQSARAMVFSIPAPQSAGSGSHAGVLNSSRTLVSARTSAQTVIQSRLSAPTLDSPAILSGVVEQSHDGSHADFTRQATLQSLVLSPAPHNVASGKDDTQEPFKRPSVFENQTISSEQCDVVSDLLPRPPAYPSARSHHSTTGRSAQNTSSPVPILDMGRVQEQKSTPSKQTDPCDSNQHGSRAGNDSAMHTGSTMDDSAMNPNDKPSLLPNSVRDSCQGPNSGGTVFESCLSVPDSTNSKPGSYLHTVQGKLWYHHTSLHVSMLHVLLRLLLTPHGSMDPLYAQPFPADTGRLNTEHVLAWHFAAPPGCAVIPTLLEQLTDTSVSATEQASNTACLRLLRLLSRQLFEPSRYTDLAHHARGAYGSIFRAKVVGEKGSTQHVIIKSIDLPSSNFDRCVLPEVCGEVSILDKYTLQPSMPELLPNAEFQSAVTASRKGYAGICQLRDYGLTQNAYWLVLHRYTCSLTEWRSKQHSAHHHTPAAVAMYLSVLIQIVDSLLVLSNDSIVHFDLKGTNVLVEPLPGVRDTQLYGPPPPPPCNPVFRAVLADFGEARIYQNADAAYTARNRGTEVYKSPEMLLMRANPTQGGGSGVLGPHGEGGAGQASDVWSLGCMAYELLSGRLFSSEADYASVTHRVAFGEGPHFKLAPPEVSALGPLGADYLAGFVEWILTRDPSKRPTLPAIRQHIESLHGEIVSLVSTGTI